MWSKAVFIFFIDIQVWAKKEKVRCEMTWKRSWWQHEFVKSDLYSVTSTMTVTHWLSLITSKKKNKKKKKHTALSALNGEYSDQLLVLTGKCSCQVARAAFLQMSNKTREVIITGIASIDNVLNNNNNNNNNACSRWWRCVLSACETRTRESRQRTEGSTAELTSNKEKHRRSKEKSSNKGRLRASYVYLQRESSRQTSQQTNRSGRWTSMKCCQKQCSWKECF